MTNVVFIMKEIRKIIQTFDSIKHNVEKVALASVVNVEESSYRRIGARMLVRSSGLWIGGISGGCLEGDALKRSQKAIFKDSSSRIVYDTMDDDQNQIGVGLGCNGRIEVIFSPINPEDPNNEIEILRKITSSEQPSIVLKIIDSPGRIEWLGKTRLYDDTIKQDYWKIPHEEIESFISITKEKKKPTIFKTKTGQGEDIKILLEFIRPETRLVIVGDNYDVMALIEISAIMGWQTYVVGKAKKLSKEVYENALKVLDYKQIPEISIHHYTAVILMTHDYDKDKKYLPYFIKSKPSYLGLLGPKKRMLKMQNEMSELDLEAVSYFYSPVGLEIGAESPEEIALSIAAEIVACFRDKPGKSLKYKKGTIHDRKQ